MATTDLPFFPQFLVVAMPSKIHSARKIHKTRMAQNK
jgi:hypothetical protein